MMRIVFMGTPEFAVPTLQLLVQHGYDVPAVVTAPDKPGGRLGLQMSAVKKAALSMGIPVLQPPKLRDPGFLESLRAYRADLQVVVAFRMLPEVVWNMPPMGTLNLHASLLPRYRGAAPINWAIINGETLTGLTTFLLRHDIDTGDLLFQEKVAIGTDETAGMLHDRMMHIGAGLVLQTVQALQTGAATPAPQDHTQATHAPKIFTENCRIDFSKSTQEIHNLVRGLSPHPGAWTIFDEKVMKIYSTQQAYTYPVKGTPGRFFSDGKLYLYIETADGYIQVTDLQLEGKKRMGVRDFLNGYKYPWHAL
jgi:methionyl-tRNA formyltransferase